MSYHDQSIAQILAKLETSKDGLTVDSVRDRQQRLAKNVLSDTNSAHTTAKIFFRQFISPLMLILIVAGIVSLVLAEYTDVIIIATIVCINAVVGFVQENKANRALLALQQMVTYSSIVMRNGKQERIPSDKLVVGDILLIGAGDKIQADGRLIEVQALQVNEAVLTGESEPVKKKTTVLPMDTPLADRKNMVYRGTTVVGGRGVVVVTATGKDTAVGEIATLVDTTKEEKTPLQKQLERLGKQLGVLVLIIASSIVVLGLFWQGQTVYHLAELFRTAIAVAVAAVPEGLLISLTVILAIGMQQILKRRALVRKLVAAETLGSVSVICTDKTGTLTEGTMTVTSLALQDYTGGQKEFSLLQKEKALPLSIGTAVRIAVLCNDAARPSTSENDHKVKKYIGDTTEVALAEFGELMGVQKESLDKAMPRVGEIPFSSDRMYMLTSHAHEQGEIWYVKGALEKLLSRCTFVLDKYGTEVACTKGVIQYFLEQEKEMTKRGLRVLALAYRVVSAEMRQKKKIQDTDVDGLVLVGLVGMSDPLRSDVKQTFQIAKQAGIRVTMITGDHRRTAVAIAKELGLKTDDHMILDGAELEEMNDTQLAEAVNTTTVFARVNPKHKIRIVRALQANGEVVAMTGDGVNDAPAIKGADIGVAVGSGTDVARETADVVLLDDSFSAIVAAVEEGRRIYQNVKKVVLYLLVGSLAEVLLIVTSIIAGMPLALLPAQILWINIVKETFPAIAFAFDPGNPGLMREPPRKKQRSLFDPIMKTLIVTVSLVTNILLFVVFVFYLRNNETIALARTMMFAGLGIGSLFYLYSIRAQHEPVWSVSLWNNWYVTAAVLFGAAMMLIGIYVPPVQYVLQTVPLDIIDWIVVIGFSFLNLVLIEIVKYVTRKHKSYVQSSS